MLFTDNCFHGKNDVHNCLFILLNSIGWLTKNELSIIAGLEWSCRASKNSFPGSTSKPNPCRISCDHNKWHE